MTRQRETVELIGGEIYFSDDHWVTIWRQRRGTSHRVVRDKAEADRVRYVATVQHGGGPDDPRRKKGKKL
jgi:hypothetical protein